MSLVVRSPLLRAVLAAGSVGALVAGAMTSTPVLLVLAMVLLLPVMTSLSPAGRLSVALQGLKDRAVHVAAWGAPIRSPSTPLHVTSIRAVGAGLVIYLEDVGEKPTLLKVAQPRSWRVQNARVVIGEAAYVQWAGKRLARADGAPAVAIEPVGSDAPRP